MRDGLKKWKRMLTLLFAIGLLSIGTIVLAGESSITYEIKSVENNEKKPADYKAKYTANKYTIRYVGNGATSGKMADKKKCVYGKKYVLAKNTYKRTGYKFTGWNTKANGKGKSYANKASVKNLSSKENAIVKLYAQWKKCTYSITYNLNGGKNHPNNPGTYKVTTATITLQKPTKTGYTFAGWFSDSTFKTKVTQIKKGSTGNKTLYAKWTANKYTIRYNGNGATSGVMADQTGCVYGTNYVLAANKYKRNNYIFTGWNTKADGTGTNYANKATVKNLSSTNSGVTTLYAQWKANVSIPATLTINVGDNTAKIQVSGYDKTTMSQGYSATSSNAKLISVGSINDSGYVELYAHNAGNATITITVSGVTMKCEVTAVMPGGGNPDPEDEKKSKSLGNITQYIGEAWGYSFDDTIASQMGLTDVDHAKVEWISDDETVATVEPYPEVFGTQNEVYVTFVGAGTTKIHARYTKVEDGTEVVYEEYLDIECLGIDDAYMSVAQNTGASYSTSTSGDSVTGITFGRKANSVIGQAALEGAEAKAFNNPSGFTTYTQNGVLYVFLTDAWNNRLLVYKSTAATPTILDAIADGAGNLKDPVLVLGQPNATSSRPGYGMENLNWCMDCEVDSQGRLYVADTNNNRIQVWDDIATKVEAGVSGVAADHSITWTSDDHSDVMNHLNWIWALEIANVDGVDKLIVTSTGNGEILIWDTLPTVWDEYADIEQGYVTENYYPDLFLRCKWGDSPRTITWTGSQLLVGDENINGYSNSYGRQAGIRVFNAWPTVAGLNGKGFVPTEKVIMTGSENSYMQYCYLSDGANQLEDFSALDDYGEGIMIGGKLYFASSMSVQIFNNGVIEPGKQPDRSVQKTLYNTGLTGDTSGLSGYAPAATGGLQQMIYEEATGRLYLAMHFGGGIAVWDNAVTRFETATQPESEAGTNIYSCPFPEYRVGATHYDYDTKSEYAKIMQLHSPIPDTDGEHLVVLNDFDQVLRVYKNIPTSSGALPDYCYCLPFESGDVDLYKDSSGKVTMMLTARTQNIIYIWNDYKFDGAMPDTIVSKGMGGVYFPMGTFGNIEYDGNYTYLTVGKPDGSRQIVVFNGIVSKTSKPIAYIDGTSSANAELGIDQYHGQMTSNGTYLSVVADKQNIMIFTKSQIASEPEANPVHLTRDDASLVNQVNFGENATAENDFDGNSEVCSGNHFNIYTTADKTYHIRNVFYGAIDSVITEDGKFIVCDGAEYEVIIWNSVQDAIDGVAPASIIGRGASEYDFDMMAGIFNYHERRLQTFDDALAMPYYLAYDGTNLWVGEFKFSNRLLRFNIK